MSAWTAFYIQTSNVEKVEKTLIQLLEGSTFRVKHQQAYQDLPSKWKQPEGVPEFMAIGQEQDTWVTIWHNTFDKLEHWGSYIAEIFDSTVIITSAESVSMWTYLARYQSGKLTKETEEFSWQEMVDYTSSEGLQIEFDYSDILWTTIDLGPEGGETIGELEQSLLNPVAKPWWKFW